MSTYEVLSDNRLAVESLLDRLALPAPYIVTRLAEVHVTVADVDSLGAWVMALGGEVRRGPETDGASMWTLRTQTPVRGDGSTVAIRVHVPIVAGEDVIGGLYEGQVTAP